MRMAAPGAAATRYPEPDVVVLDPRVERRHVPGSQRIYRLDIVVPVN